MKAREGRREGGREEGAYQHISRPEHGGRVVGGAREVPRMTAPCLPHCGLHAPRKGGREGGRGGREGVKCQE